MERERKNAALTIFRLDREHQKFHTINERINTETHLRKLILQNEQEIKITPPLRKEVTDPNGFKEQ